MFSNTILLTCDLNSHVGSALLEKQTVAGEACLDESGSGSVRSFTHPAMLFILCVDSAVVFDSITTHIQESQSPDLRGQIWNNSYTLGTIRVSVLYSSCV